MANTVISSASVTPGKIAKESLKLLINNLVAARLVHQEFKNEFVKEGNAVSIRKPVRFTVSDGATRVNQDVTETTTSITVDQRKHVSWKFSTTDLTLSIEEYTARYIKPATETLADNVDLAVLARCLDFGNSVGTPGTTPNAFSILGDAATKLDNLACPSGDRATVLNPAANWTMADALKMHPHQANANEFLRKGMLGTMAGSDVYMSQNVKRFTAGPRGGTPLVNGAAQTGASLITDGWTAAAAARVVVGDVFTLPSVFAVNPINKQSTGQLKQFVVAPTSTLASDGSGNLTLTIAPAITTTTAYQNVSAGPADNGALTFVGTASTEYPQNFMFHKNSIALVMVPLELPDSAAFKARASAHGVSIRVIKDYDIDTDDEVIRLDILYGTKTLYDDCGCRIWG